MARILGLLFLLAVVAYGIWPYSSLFRINSALQEPNAEALAPFVDLTAIQTHYKTRIGRGISGFLPPTEDQDQTEAEQVIGWLTDNLKRLGDAALEQAITLDWVRTTLLDAGQRADAQSSSFVGAIDFAFFESWDRFVVRFGEIGEHPTFVILSLEDGEWRITDITG
ncbi:MAG: DUF2939 domain-containing protein [Halochromatium sp.]|uniref:DUF2939 domain-containing protein n=1 Tax=Halochromatium sp. TaxID=2049430 RepID=UPI00397B3EC1